MVNLRVLLLGNLLCICFLGGNHTGTGLCLSHLHSDLVQNLVVYILCFVFLLGCRSHGLAHHVLLHLELHLLLLELPKHLRNRRNIHAFICVGHNLGGRPHRLQNYLLSARGSQLHAHSL